MVLTNMKSIIISVRFTPKEIAYIRKVARKVKKSVSELIRRGVFREIIGLDK